MTHVNTYPSGTAASPAGTGHFIRGVFRPAVVLSLSLAVYTVTLLALPVPAPSTNTVHLSMSVTHPRLLLSASSIPMIKGSIVSNTMASNIYNTVKSSADSILTQPVSIYEKPDGLRLLDVSRKVLSRVYTLAFMYLMVSNSAYLNRAWDELEAAGNFPDWNTNHYLDTAEMMHAFAIGYDWLYNSLSATQRTFIETNTMIRGLTNSYNILRGFSSYFWVNSDNNWNFVCSGGSAIGAMAFENVYPAMCDTIIVKSFESIQALLPKFDPDGAWYEGPGYWDYSLKYIVPHVASMESAMGTNFGILGPFGGLGKTGDFPVYLTGTSGYSFNFADAGTSQLAAAELFWLSRRFNNQLWSWFQGAYHPEKNVEALLYFSNGMATNIPGGAELDRVFRDPLVECATMRGSWTDTNALFVGVKAGKNGVSHGQLDLGSFVLDALGQRFIDDLGADDYNMPGYFGAQRYTYYRLRAEGHNTIVINPSTNLDQAGAAAASFSLFEAGRGILDLTAVYSSNSATNVTREIRMLDGRQALRISDDIGTTNATNIYWFAHTRAAIAITGSNTAKLTRGSSSIYATLLYPADGVFTVLSAVPLACSTNPSMQNTNAGYSKLTVRVTNRQNVRISVIFTLSSNLPGDAYTGLWVTPPLVTGAPANLTTNQTFTIALDVDKNYGYWSTNGAGAFQQFTAAGTNITINSTTTLMYYGNDGAGNAGITNTRVYTFDTAAPVITGVPATFTTNRPFMIEIDVNENNCYWSTNGRSGPYQKAVAPGGAVIIQKSGSFHYYGRDVLGNTGSTNSNYYSIIVTRPDMPTNLSTSANVSGIRLQWADNSFNEDGFRIYRSSNNTVYTNIAVTSSNTILYDDTTAAAGVMYWYKIAATNQAGESSTNGPVSNVVPMQIVLTNGSASVLAASNAVIMRYTLTKNFSQPAYMRFSYAAASSGIWTDLQSNVSGTIVLPGNGSFSNLWLSPAVDTNLHYDIRIIASNGACACTNIIPAVTMSGMFTVAADLTTACIVNNPFRQGGIILVNLTPVTKCSVYSISGKLIADIGTASPGGRILWDGTAADGRRIVPGVYLCILRSQKESKVLKLVVSR
ncbi:MAG: heparinase II/III family protein [Spirochaetes bacterium]|nr:heparinase II/III family protein [Spirochaetota bacterium]